MTRWCKKDIYSMRTQNKQTLKEIICKLVDSLDKNQLKISISFINIFKTVIVPSELFML